MRTGAGPGKDPVPGTDPWTQLQAIGQWRAAVWTLRVGYGGLVVALSGVVVVALGSTRWVLSVGVVIWIATAIVTVTEVLRARHALPDPRPGFWSIRLMLVRDTVWSHRPASSQLDAPKP